MGTEAERKRAFRGLDPRGGLSPGSRGRAAADPIHAGLELQARRQRQEIGRAGACDRRGHRLGPEAGAQPRWSRSPRPRDGGRREAARPRPSDDPAPNDGARMTRRPAADGRRRSTDRAIRAGSAGDQPEPTYSSILARSAFNPRTCSWQHKAKRSCSPTFIHCSSGATSPRPTAMPLGSRY